MTKAYLGNCQDEDLIESIFGSVSEFARLTEEHGDNFTHHYSMFDKDVIRVEYDDENDIHSFHSVKEA